MNNKQLSWAVIAITLLINITIIMFIWDIQFWPTDTKAYYFDAAVRLKDLTFISEMHESFDQPRVRWLHGKEFFIYLASLLQRIMCDETTLRPFILVCSAAVGVSSVLVFEITRRIFNDTIGLLCYFLFTTSFWPYLYILFAKHQPLGLMFFLISVLCFLCAHQTRVGWVLKILSGAALCAALFSSSVSALYVPYVFGLLVWHYFLRSDDCVERKIQRDVQAISFDCGLLTVGGVVVLIWLTLPHIWHNIISFWEYVEVSVGYNHFYYNQPNLQQWIPDNIATSHGGWLWIIKYFFLIMPVLFPVFCLCLLLLFVDALRTAQTDQTPKVYVLATLMVLLCLSSPILANVKKVAQYGANYFTSLVGIILLVGYTAYRWEHHLSSLRASARRGVYGLVIFLAVLQIGINGYAFASDIYPSRMATTFISGKIQELGIKKLYTYPQHPHQLHLVGQLNDWVKAHVLFVPMQTIFKVKKGYAYIPPITKDSIYIAAHSDYQQFDKDPFLNKLIIDNRLKDYAVASFKTLASSRYWAHEEEILTYRYLVLGHKPYEQETLSRAWIIDLQRFQNEIGNNYPSDDQIFTLQNDIYNIGTVHGMNQYRGFLGTVEQTSDFTTFAARIYKVGQPGDGLKAYLYQLDDVQSVWIPVTGVNSSTVVPAESILNDDRGGLAVFKFDPALKARRGPYMIKIYRTGSPDDKNYYRLYHKFQNRMES